MNSSHFHNILDSFFYIYSVIHSQVDERWVLLSHHAIEVISSVFTIRTYVVCVCGLFYRESIFNLNSTHNAHSLIAMFCHYSMLLSLKTVELLIHISISIKLNHLVTKHLYWHNSDLDSKLFTWYFDWILCYIPIFLLSRKKQQQ